jgi:signal transduction histidine kinase
MNRIETSLRLFNPDEPNQPEASEPSGSDVLPNKTRSSETRESSHLPNGTSPMVASGDLEMVLAAWHSATERLQKTHEVLCSEVRRLTEELAAKNQELARKSRLADLGQMASHVAHEVRNGLSPVTLYLSWLRRRLADDLDALRIIDKLEAGCTEVQSTVSDMLSFAADREPQWRRFALRDLIDELLDTLAPQFSAHQIVVRLDVPVMNMWGDRDLLRRAVINLLLNAVDAMPEGGGIWITAYPCNGAIELEVADNGPGLSDEALERVFEPFFTTKSDGSGLGLAIVQRVAEAHGGDVCVKNCPEGGAAFILRVPHRAMEAAA